MVMDVLWLYLQILLSVNLSANLASNNYNFQIAIGSFLKENMLKIMILL